MAGNERIADFLSLLSEDERAIYAPVTERLSALGYKAVQMRGQGYVLSFKHPVSKKQIVKAGVRGRKPAPFFMLRFSASESYPGKAAAAVTKWCADEVRGIPACGKGCSLCKGGRHFYTGERNGETVDKCGTYALEIPGFSAEDLPDVLTLIGAQHEYFEKY